MIIMTLVRARSKKKYLVFQTELSVVDATLNEECPLIEHSNRVNCIPRCSNK